MKTYRLTVVTLVSTKPREYKDFHVDFKVSDPVKAEEFRNLVAGKGFTHQGRRFFPDQIESLQLSEVTPNEQQVS